MIDLDQDPMDNNINHIVPIEDFFQVYPMFFNNKHSVKISKKKKPSYRNIVLTVEGNCRCKSLTNVSVS
jgi:hypothetical protein